MCCIFSFSFPCHSFHLQSLYSSLTFPLTFATFCSPSALLLLAPLSSSQFVPSLCVFLSVTYVLKAVSATDAQGNIEIPFQPERHGNIDQNQQPPSGFANVQGSNVPFAPSQFSGPEEAGQMNPNLYGQMMSPQMQQAQGQMYPAPGQGNSPYGSPMVQPMQSSMASPMQSPMQPPNPYQAAMTNQPMNPQMSMSSPGYPGQGFNMQGQQQQSPYAMSPSDSPQATFARVMAPQAVHKSGMSYGSSMSPQYSNLPKASGLQPGRPGSPSQMSLPSRGEEAIESREPDFD